MLFGLDVKVRPSATASPWMMVARKESPSHVPRREFGGCWASERGMCARACVRVCVCACVLPRATQNLTCASALPKAS